MQGVVERKIAQEGKNRIIETNWGCVSYAEVMRLAEDKQGCRAASNQSVDVHQRENESHTNAWDSTLRI